MIPVDWNRLLEEHGDFALGLAIERMRRAGRGRAEAEEALQEAWLSLLRAGGAGLSDARNERAYLAAAVLNACRMWLRTGARRERRELARPPAPAEYGLTAEEAEELEASLAALDPRQRLLLQMVHGQGLSYGDAASFLDMEANSVGPALSRAKEALRTVVEGRKNR